MSRNTATFLVAPVVVLALAGGCQLLIGVDGGSPRKTGSGGGGAGGATSTSSTTSSTGGTGGAGTGGTGTGGTDGSTDGGTDGSTDSGADGSTDSGADGSTDSGTDSGVDGGCTTAATCPAAQQCHMATCTGGLCATMPAAGVCAGGKVCGTPTGPNGGTCVGCNVDADCPAPQGCGATNQCALPQRVLLLAGGGGQSTVGAAYDVADGWGAATTITAITASDIALAMMPNGQGVGLIQGLPAASQLLYTFFNGPGTSPPWAAFTQLNTDATRGKPALAVTGATAHVVFQDATYLYQHESYTGGKWSTSPTPVTPAGLTSQPCGPWPGVLAPLSSGVLSLVFTNGNCPGANLNDLFNTDMTSAGWQAFKNLANNPVFAPTTYPGAALAAPLSGSPELVIAYSVVGAAQIQSSYRVNGAWMGYTSITGVLSNDELAMAPLSTGGGVVLAYRGTDGKLYTTLYTVGSASWSAPLPPFTSPTTIAGPPAVVKGIGVAAAEMAYLDATGAAWHTRLVGGMWTAPVPVAMGTTGFTNVAIASGP